MKIFGIGLNKSGTTSLKSWLQQAGYRTLHGWGKGAAICEAVRRGESHPLLEEYDAFFDAPYWLIAEELAARFPEARFIYHHRDREQWIQSRVIHCLYNRITEEHPWTMIDTRSWEQEYERCEQVVREFSAPERLVSVNLDDPQPELWARALGIGPEIPFPRQNTSMEKLRAIAHLKQPDSPTPPPVVLACRTETNWRDLTDLYGDENKYHEKPPSLAWWGELFALSYAEYRERVRQIARENWNRIAGLGGILLNQQLLTQAPPGTLVVPVDDDDWFSPALVHSLQKIWSDSTAEVARPEAYVWETPVLRSELDGRVSPVASRDYHPDCFSTNGYALTPAAARRLRLFDYEMAARWHVKTHTYLKSFQEMQAALGVYVIHWASITTMRKIQSRDQLREMVQNFRQLPELPGYETELAQLQQLNQELQHSLFSPR